jgi:hypothetical protein
LQNQYVGDIGDFGKYGLLKNLCFDNDKPRLKLGVLWYLFPDEMGKNDGKYVEYLEKPDFKSVKLRKCDPDLCQSLKIIVKSKNRNIAAVQESGIFPSDTIYYDSPLAYGKNIPIDKRESIRAQWLQKGYDIVKGQDIIFFDPDNGLEVKSVKMHNLKGPKYVFYDDLPTIIDRQQSLVIYQHLCRSEDAKNQIERRGDEMKNKLGVKNVFAIRYRRGPARVFFIIPSPHHTNILKERIEHLVISKNPWSNHFTPM